MHLEKRKSFDESPGVCVEGSQDEESQNYPRRQRQRFEALCFPNFPEQVNSQGTSDGTNSDAYCTIIREPSFLIAEKRRLVQHQQVLLAIEFLEDGTHQFVELRRDDILRKVRAVVPPIDTDDPRFLEEQQMLHDLCSKVPKKLHEQLNSIEKLEARVRFKGTLQNRDLRLLDPVFSHSREPAILVRRHAILANMWPIKALLMHNSTLVFLPDGADSIIETLMGRFQEGFAGDNMEIKGMNVSCILVCLFSFFLPMLYSRFRLSCAVWRLYLLLFVAHWISM